MGNGITNCYPDEVGKFISLTVLRPRPEDGAPLLAADGVEAVPAGSAGGQVAGLARGVSAAPGGGGGLLGAGASPGAPAAEVPRQLYETVKRFVRPLRETKLHAAVTRTRFETPPGLQSQSGLGAAVVAAVTLWGVRPAGAAV